LAKSEIYATPLVNLNDPFEATAFIDHKSFELGHLLLGGSKKLYSSNAQNADARFKQALQEFVSFTKGTGIYSLSKVATDELLWAYYANAHQGFCLEFDLEQMLEYKMKDEVVLEVDYSPKPPVVSIKEFLASTDPQSALLKKLVGTKSLRWRHEQEIRVVVGIAGLREYDFRSLKAVYFGLRCNDRLIRLAMRLLRGRGLNYYQMQLVDGSYVLEPIQLQDDYPSAPKYRARIAPVEEGVPYIDDKLRPFEKQIRTAVEMARREPYCDR